jgi:Fic family protein
MIEYRDIVDMWQGWRVESAGDIDHRLENFRILFAYNSGKIENPEITYGDTREIFENGRVLNFSGSLRSLFELGNQKLCYEFLKPKIAVREPLSIPLILETHAILTAGTYDETRYIARGERPGQFKIHDYVTGRAEVGSPPKNVRDDISALLDELADFSGDKTLTAAAYFHARFEYIHPFADGNGRVGRALSNYFLMTHNHPPMIIYDDDKSAYYDALERYDETEEIAPLRDFFATQTIKTWEKSFSRKS